MPIVLLILIPLLITICAAPFLKRRVPLERLAASIAFVVAVVLISLFVVGEWRESYGPFKVVEAILAILFDSALVSAFHWFGWWLGLKGWQRLRGEARGRA